VDGRRWVEAGVPAPTLTSALFSDSIHAAWTSSQQSAVSHGKGFGGHNENPTHRRCRLGPIMTFFSRA